jgi:hypothetical protein
MSDRDNLDRLMEQEFPHLYQTLFIAYPFGEAVKVLTANDWMAKSGGVEKCPGAVEMINETHRVWDLYVARTKCLKYELSTYQCSRGQRYAMMQKDGLRRTCGGLFWTHEIMPAIFEDIGLGDNAVRPWCCV